MDALTQPRPVRRWGPRWAWLVAGLGLLTTGIALGVHERLNRARLQSLMDAEIQRVMLDLVSRMHQLEHNLQGTRGAAMAVGWQHLDRPTFERYSRSRELDTLMPGVRGIGLVRRVPADEEQAFARAAAADGWPGFAVRQLEPHDRERLVVQYIEPAERNRQAVGLDIASEAHRRGAAEQAMRSGRATLTHPITLVQASSRPHSGFLMLLPVYAGGVTPTDEDRRRREAIGFTYAPLVAHDLLAGLNLHLRHVALTLTDAASGAVFFRSDPDPAAPAREAIATTVERRMAGRTWRLELHSLPSLAQAHGLVTPAVTALMGGLLTVLAAVAVHASLRARSSARDLRAEQARRALALQTSRDAVVLTDAAGSIVDWNEGAVQLLGHAQAEALGRPAVELLAAGEQRDRLDRLVRQGLQGHAGGAQDLCCRHRDGQDLDVSVLVVPLKGREDSASGVALAMRDIRVQKAAERQAHTLNTALAAALREKEALLDAVKTQAIVSIADASGRIVEVNDPFCRISKYRRDELLGQDHRLINSGVHSREFWLQMWRTIAEGRSWRGQVCNRAKDGTLYWVDSTIAPVLGDGGQIHHYVSIRFDITEARHAQERLRASEELLDRAGRLARVGAWELDLRTQQLTWSVQTRLIHELDADRQPSFDEAVEFVDATARSQLHEALARAVERHEGWDLELPAITATGRRIQLRMAAAVDLAEGRAVRLYGALQDVTERKAFERSLEEATARAEAANRAKSEFLANMSHEIRSPLNAMMGLTWLLRQSPLDAEQVMLLDRARHAGDALARTLNDVLDISRIEAGEMPIAAEPIDLARIAQGVVAMLAVQAQSRGLQLALDLDPALPPCVLGDSLRVTQVLTNLVANAIKFTATGWVRASIGWAGETASRGRALLQVADSGIGIDADARQRIFEPFVQADGSTTRRFGGSGLGLAIVRHLVQRMDGSIALDSRPGEGSRFTVVIPFDSVAEPGPAPAAVAETGTDALFGRTILVVDDSEINRDVAQRILQRRGARVLLAEDGAQAVDLMRRTPGAVDLVLMDLHMPVMDGFEATRRIRHELGREQLPVFALSAGVTPAERLAARDAGMDDFIAKPLDPPRLLQSVVQRLLGAAAGDGRAARAAHAPAANAGWPEVDGIDIADARERLGDDPALFRHLLGRLFDDRSSPAEQGDAAHQRAAQVARLHRLSGNSGTLGMRRLHALAKDLEMRLRQGQDHGLEALTADVEREFERLRIACAPLLAGTDPSSAPQAEAAPLAQADLDELRSLLERNNMRATERFEALAPALKLALPDSSFDALRADVQNLAFAQALAALAGVKGERLT